MLLFALALSAFGTRGDPSQSVRYRLTDLGTLGGKYSVATDLNASGTVVGYSETSNGTVHGFVHNGRRMEDLGTVGGDNSFAHAINDQGVIVGASQTFTGTTRAFMHVRSAMRTQGVLGETHPMSFARDVNNRGTLVGHCRTLEIPPSPWFDDRACVIFGSDATDLGVQTGNWSSATGINDQGVIVGTRMYRTGLTRAFRYFKGKWSEISALGDLGWGYSGAEAVNERGQIAASVDTGDRVYRAVLLTPVRG
jgi:probable HAF family extracellular repeat protein